MNANNRANLLSVQPYVQFSALLSAQPDRCPVAGQAFLVGHQLGVVGDLLVHVMTPMLYTCEQGWPTRVVAITS